MPDLSRTSTVHGLGGDAVEPIGAVEAAVQAFPIAPPRSAADETFRVEVSDETGMLLSTVIILKIDAPVARGLRQPRNATD